MKKRLMVISLLLCMVIVTGCGNNLGKVDDSKLSVYEIHEYDAEFKHTEEIVAKFDDEGKLKYAEYITVYDREMTVCPTKIKQWNETEDSKYEDVKYSCEAKDGKTTIKWSMTDKSLNDGYLTDNKTFSSRLKGSYNNIKDEETAKKVWNEHITKFRDENLFAVDERNYIIIDGERIDS
ncbi:MAG: hypothetical protein E7163_02280 [Firmicutes bacterium]|nr:hypothetical protein [Bacillota bacterium]